jgi:DNA-binding transcriptional ArsR family regulator
MDRLTAVVNAAKAIGHPGRLRILAMLREGELCVCQITALLKLAPSTVSAHLSDLRRSGLVAERKDARWVHYRLTDEEPLKGLIDDALALVERDPQIRDDATLLRGLRKVPLETICSIGFDVDAVRTEPHRQRIGRPRQRRLHPGGRTG